jgi:DHA1 family tetracycline resistance protein-like MFS transporter
MYIAFLVILIDMIGFGIMVPIFAFYVLKFGASPALATVMMSLYVGAMFLTTPLLGRLSDLYGRRPVMMLSMLGATAGYILLAFATNLWMVGISRLISGAMAGNISTAQAYITDVTTEENRAKGMGLIGAAFGLGFIIGPAIGSILAGNDFDSANLALPAMVSAGMTFAAFLMIVFVLPESLAKEHRDAAKKRPQVSRLDSFKQVLGRRLILEIIICALLFNIAAGLFEALFPIWISDTPGGTGLVHGPKGLLPYLLVGGFTLAIVQGGLIGKLTQKFGEHTLLRAGALLYGAALFGMTVAADLVNKPFTFFFMAVVSAAGAMIMTCTQSLVSMCAEKTERGVVMGVYNSVSTIGRFAGTLITGTLFHELYKHAPYWTCGVLMLILIWMSFSMQKHWNQEEASRLANIG